MVSVFLESGHPHCGSYLFVRSEEALSDESLLDAIGLGVYQATDALFDSQRHLVIGNSPTWTVVGDDFEWEKFHSPSELEVLASLVAGVDEALLCRLPDIDEGFDFFYWREGALVRSYQKRSADWGRTFTIQQQGTPIAAEASPVVGNDGPTERVWAIARSLGFDLAESAGSYRVFAGPEMERLGLEGPFISSVPRRFLENPILGPRLRWRRS